MKVLFLSNVLSNGGAERVMSILANNVAENGDECIVLLYYKSNGEYYLNQNINKIYLYNHPKEKKDNIITKFKSILKIRQVIKKEKPDYIIPFIISPMIEGYFASRFIKTKFISTIRVNPAIAKKNIKLFLRNHVIKKSYKIIVQNSEQKEYFNKKIHHRILILPNPISSVFFEKQKEYIETKTIRIITAGRLENQKNHKLLINAVIELRKKFNITLEIYGNGSLYNELKEYIELKNANSFICLMGNVSDINNRLLNADVFVLSSNFEGLPNALIEAMAVGLACVSTNCPTGPSSIISNREDGILCETNDLESMVNSLELLLKDFAFMKYLGNNARIKMLNNYSEKIVIEKFYSILKE